MTALYVFSALTILDFVWGLYIKAVSEGRRFASSFWAVPLYAISGYATIEFVHNPVMLIPASAGAFVGTYLSVWWKTRK